jgi:hypothetical protein
MCDFLKKKLYILYIIYDIKINIVKRALLAKNEKVFSRRSFISGACCIRATIVISDKKRSFLNKGLNLINMLKLVIPMPRYLRKINIINYRPI